MKSTTDNIIEIKIVRQGKTKSIAIVIKEITRISELKRRGKQRKRTNKLIKEKKTVVYRASKHAVSTKLKLERAKPTYH